MSTCFGNSAVNRNRIYELITMDGNYLKSLILQINELSTFIIQIQSVEFS